MFDGKDSVIDLVNTIDVQAVQPEDRFYVKEILTDRWGESRIVVHGTVYEAELLPGFIARFNAVVVGLITFSIQNNECEIVSLDSMREEMGVGNALLQATSREAIKAGCRRMWLVTTNDNLGALGFYQRRGFLISSIHPGEVEKARKIKPSIPLVGKNGIPIQDEIHLEIDPIRLVE